MEKRPSILYLMLCTLISCWFSYGSSSTINTPSGPVRKVRLSSNDVYPRAQNTSLEYLRASYLVQQMLKEDDRSYDVKILPNDHEVSTYIHNGEVKRLMFPLLVQGPLTIIVTPCASPLAWTLSLRPNYSHQPHEYSHDSNLYDYNEIARDPTKLESIDSLRNYKYSRITQRRITDSMLGTAPGFDSSINVHEEFGRNFREIRDVKITNDFTNEWNVNHSVSNGRQSFQNDAFWRERKHRKNTRRHETILKKYEGYESIVFQRQSVPPGLYVLQVRALWGATHIHVKAKKDWVPPPATVHVSAVTTTKENGIILRWPSSFTGAGYCLVVSEGRSYPSLCAARAAREGNNQSPPSRSHVERRRHHYRRRSQRRRKLKNPLLLLGCTNRPWFRLSSAPAHTLHVAVWEAGVAGPPLGQGIVKPSRRTKVPRLKSGELMTLVPSAGGKATVKFKVRRRGRRLHIMAVACGTELKLKVETRNGRSLGSAVGRLGALHMILEDLPPASMTLSLKTNPPGAANSILITATHTTRTLPLPRLPRKVRVKVKNVTCTSAVIKWFKAPGNSSYCVLVEELSIGTVWRARPPRQCGWETVVKNSSHYTDKWCGPPKKTKRQMYTTEALTPDTTYIITVLVQHTLTGRTLALPPTKITTANCTVL